MSEIYLILKHWYWLAIGFLAFVLLVCGMKLNKQELQINAYSEQIKKQKAAIMQYQAAQKAGEEYEQQKAAREVETQIIYRDVAKIVEKPVYRNICIDADGLQQLNKAIANTAK